jgi:hypothetical protein
MATVRLNVTTAGLDAMQAILDPARFRKDVSAGLRYAGRGAKTTAAKEIGARYALTAARIKQDIKTPVILENAVDIPFDRRPPTLRAYSGRPTGSRTTSRGTGLPTGIKFKIFKGPYQTRQNVFWAQTKGQPFPGLPMRRPPLGNQSYGYGVAYGPSIGAIFTGEGRLAPELRKATVERFQVQFITGVKRELGRRSRGF